VGTQDPENRRWPLVSQRPKEVFRGLGAAEPPDRGASRPVGHQHDRFGPGGCGVKVCRLTISSKAREGASRRLGGLGPPGVRGQSPPVGERALGARGREPFLGFGRLREAQRAECAVLGF